MGKCLYLIPNKYGHKSTSNQYEKDNKQGNKAVLANHIKLLKCWRIFIVEEFIGGYNSKWGCGNQNKRINEDLSNCKNNILFISHHFYLFIFSSCDLIFSGTKSYNLWKGQKLDHF